MRNASLVLSLAVFASTFSLLHAPSAVAQSERGRSDSGAPANRDFGGTWERYPPATSSASTPGPLAPSAGPPLLASPPPPLKQQYLAEYEAGQKKIREADARGEPIATGYTHCLPDGMPSMMMAMFPMEVLQTAGQVTIIQEAYNQVRRIYIGAPAVPIEDAEPGFWGHSTAKWDGDTLVVDTVGIKDYVRFRNVPHSAQMRISERMHVFDADHFEDQITITDPVYLTSAWTFTWRYQRKPDYKLYEYVCEDNREFADPESGKARMRFKKDE
ncbi:MAG: hypothetical protein ABI640_12335 [Gammaproteobacteria bacterium]